jgi:hypothetical protein
LRVQVNCAVCIKAKQPRASYKSEKTPEEPVQLMHSMGPVEVESLSECLYAVPLLDNHSGLVEVGCFEPKSDGGAWLQQKILGWERAMGHKFKAIRTDRGKECQGPLEGWLKDRGIQHQTSAAHTPQQNGRAERINRTLIEKTHAMRMEKNLPKELWAATIQAAAHIHNATPAARLEMTPLEMFYCKPADTESLRVFGSMAYPLTPKAKQKKLDARSETGLFIRYTEASRRFTFCAGTRARKPWSEEGTPVC